VLIRKYSIQASISRDRSASSIRSDPCIPSNNLSLSRFAARLVRARLFLVAGKPERSIPDSHAQRTRRSPDARPSDRPVVALFRASVANHGAERGGMR
jgi:hypothetical protein